MMAGMQEDTDALKEMYGVGNYDGEDAFGMVGDEAAMEDDQVEQEGAKMRRSAKGEAEEFSSDEEEVELDEDEDFQVDPTSTLTPFQQRQQRLQKRISNIESSRLDETHWTLGGETMASARPENALLGEVLEFDHTQKAKTLITEEITKSLEERLKKRIQVCKKKFKSKKAKRRKIWGGGFVVKVAKNREVVRVSSPYALPFGSVTVVALAVVKYTMST